MRMKQSKLWLLLSTKNTLTISYCKLVISVTEHLVKVVDKLSTTAVVFFRSERILKCKHLYGYIPLSI